MQIEPRFLQIYSQNYSIKISFCQLWDMCFLQIVGFSAEHKRSSTPVAMVYFARGKILA